jgi:hypothetical protein
MCFIKIRLSASNENLVAFTFYFQSKAEYKNAWTLYGLTVSNCGVL